LIDTANIGTPNPAVTTTTLATAASAISSANPWAFCADGMEHTPVPSKMAKLRHIKPAVDKIIGAGCLELQAAFLHTVVDHPALGTACIIAGIDTAKATATSKFVCNQQLWLMSHNCNM
jgi:hypothetical protein